MQDQQTVERLVLDNLRRVKWTAYNVGRRYHLSPDQIEDLASIGVVKLIERAEVFDPSIIPDFWASAHPFVQGTMKNFVSTQGRRKRVVVATWNVEDVEVAGGRGGIQNRIPVTRLMENKPDDTDLEQEAYGKQLMERAIKHCHTERSKAMFKMYFEEGLYQGEIAEVLGVTQSYVSEEINRVINRMKLDLGIVKPKKTPLSAQDLTGKRFGHWTVLGEKTLEGQSHSTSSYMCRCSCGTRRRVWTMSLVRRLSQSCGCARKRVKR